MVAEQSFEGHSHFSEKRALLNKLLISLRRMLLNPKPYPKDTITAIRHALPALHREIGMLAENGADLQAPDLTKTDMIMDDNLGHTLVPDSLTFKLEESELEHKLQKLKPLESENWKARKAEEGLEKRQQMSKGNMHKGSRPMKDTICHEVVALRRDFEQAQSLLKKKEEDLKAQAQSHDRDMEIARTIMANMQLKITQARKKIEDLELAVQNHRQLKREHEAEINALRGIGCRLEEKTEAMNEMVEQTKATLAQYQQQLTSETLKTQELSDKIARLTSYEPLGDADIADRIRIRNLIDQVQERLAITAGLQAAPGENLSLTWRLALGPSVDDASRIQRAKDLLPDENLSPQDAAFLANEDALRHVCQSYSRFRAPGNDLHKLLVRDGYLTSVARYLERSPSESAVASLGAMVDYICPVPDPSSSPNPAE